VYKDQVDIVNLWTIETQRTFAENELWSILDEEDRRYVDSAITSNERFRRLLSRATLRHVVAQILGLTPCEIPVMRRGGKPTITFHGPPRFNVSVSNTQHMIAISVSADSPVGVDIEESNREEACAAVSDLAFRRSEMDLVGVTLGNGQVISSIHLWTAKEAAFKVMASPEDIFIPTDFAVELFAGRLTCQHKEMVCSISHTQFDGHCCAVAGSQAFNLVRRQLEMP
jgi:phosphopantetheinyl transferase